MKRVADMSFKLGGPEKVRNTRFGDHLPSSSGKGIPMT